MVVIWFMNERRPTIIFFCLQNCHVLLLTMVPESLAWYYWKVNRYPIPVQFIRTVHCPFKLTYKDIFRKWVSTNFFTAISCLMPWTLQAGAKVKVLTVMTDITKHKGGVNCQLNTITSRVLYLSFTYLGFLPTRRRIKSMPSNLT